MWTGCNVLPQGLVAGLIMQQRFQFFKVEDLLEANKMCKELKDFEPPIVYRNVGSQTETEAVLTY